jgi:hypothetical protein
MASAIKHDEDKCCFKVGKGVVLDYVMSYTPLGKSLEIVGLCAPQSKHGLQAALSLASAAFDYAIEEKAKIRASLSEDADFPKELKKAVDSLLRGRADFTTDLEGNAVPK